jgi:hypothetical protein
LRPDNKRIYGKELQYLEEVLKTQIEYLGNLFESGPQN